jgi:hypothetical protein
MLELRWPEGVGGVKPPGKWWPWRVCRLTGQASAPLRRTVPMKTLASLLVLSFAVVVAAPAFAGGDKPKTQAECAGAKDMIWDDATKTCNPVKK